MLSNLTSSQLSIHNVNRKKQIMVNQTTNSNSLSQRLHKDLAALIDSTEPGDRLPTEPKLAQQLGVSRATLREAMRTFETQGLIIRRQGVGTFVVRPTQILESGLEVLESIETLAKRSGLPVELGDITIDRRAASNEEREALSLEIGDNVISISRVILAEGRPAAFLVDILPEQVLPRDELPSEFSGSVLDLLIERGNPQLINSHCEIAAIAASSTVARALHIQRGDAILQFRSHLFALDGRVVDYTYSYFLPGYFRFHVIRDLNKKE
jgi:GntR family transcriptional regulator